MIGSAKPTVDLIGKDIYQISYYYYVMIKAEFMVFSTQFISNDRTGYLFM